MVMRCVSMVSYYVTIDRAQSSLFNPKWGLKQGDPWSLFLFLIFNEGLSLLLRLSVRNDLPKGVKASQHCPYLPSSFCKR